MLSEVPVLPELCSAAGIAPSMAWTAVFAASLVYITILAASLVNRAQLAASLAALFWHYQLAAFWQRCSGSTIWTASTWQRQITNVLTDTTSVLLALLPKTHR